MHCPKCGKENNERAAFCRYCGASLAITQKNSSFIAPTPQNKEPQEISVPKPKKIVTVDEKPQKKVPVSKKQTSTKKGRKKWVALATVLVLLLGGAGYFWFTSLGGTGSTGSATIPKPDYSLIPVKQGKVWGYINPKGEYVINPQFEYAGLFYDGLARVRMAEKTGLINTKGEYVVNPEYATIGLFFDGLARVQLERDGKVGYIDKKGELAIQPIYKAGTTFSEGLAFVVPVGGHPTCIGTDGETKFVLENAKWVSSFYPLSEGLALFGTDNWNEDKYGYIDKNGKPSSIQPEADSFWKDSKLYRFELGEGLIPFSLGDKWGYKNAKEKIVINPQFDQVELFSEGLACIRQDDKIGFIDKKGKIVISPQFEPMGRGSYFVNNMAFVYSDGKFGFIDKKGNFIINPQFDGVVQFHANLRKKDTGCYGEIRFESQQGEVYAYNKGYMRMLLGDGSDVDFVISDYYDTSSFIKEFFKHSTGDSFDGFNASSTLQTIIDHPMYGNDASAEWSTHVTSRASHQFTPDIFIPFVWFDSTEEAPFYTDSDLNKEYQFDAKIAKIEYHISLNCGSEADQHRQAIIEALKTEIENRYKVTVEEKDQDILFSLQSGDNLKFKISIYSGCQ